MTIRIDGGEEDDYEKTTDKEVCLAGALLHCNLTGLYGRANFCRG